jgi:hypothetical protein
VGLSIALWQSLDWPVFLAGGGLGAGQPFVGLPCQPAPPMVKRTEIDPAAACNSASGDEPPRDSHLS